MIWLATADAVDRFKYRYVPSATTNQARLRLVELARFATPVQHCPELWETSAGLIFGARKLGPEHCEITSVLSKPKHMGLPS